MPLVSGSRKHRKRSKSGENERPRSAPIPQINAEATDLAKSNRSLFHYTSARGLIGIMESQCLFATHSEFLNDATECKMIAETLRPRLEAELKGAVPKLVQHKLMKFSALEDFDDNIFRQEADNMLHAMSQAANNTAPYFITSFCIHDVGTTAHNHSLLSQWRGYAK